MSIEISNHAGGALQPRPEGPTLAAIRWAIRAWGVYFGGAVTIVIVLLATASAASNLLLHRPVPGEYEVVKHLMAIAVFSFLPYCQLTAANVTVDIFTEGLSARGKALTSVLSALLSLIFSLILLRQMSLGFGDYLRDVEVTGILSIPLWTAYPPMLVSIVLWIAASVITLWEALRGVRSPEPAQI